MKKMVLAILCICGIFCACQKKQQMQEIQIFAMDTFMDLKAYGENAEKALLESEKEINRLESLFSSTVEKSEVYAINANAGKQAVTVSEDTLDIIQKSKQYYDITEGAFDITIAPILKAWGFTEQNKRVPPEQELQQKMELVDQSALILNENTVFLQKPDMAIDLGGIAKGFASDRVNEILKQYGVTSAVISLGGNVSAIGKKQDGTKWSVGVQDPLNAEGFIGVLHVEDTSVITSGVYQRFFEENGKKYHHIIDSTTAKPAQSGLLAVTIVCKNGAMADALSTSLMVAGLEKGSTLWRKYADFGVIFVTEQKEIYITEDIADMFEQYQNAGYGLHIIEK